MVVAAVASDVVFPESSGGFDSVFGLGAAAAAAVELLELAVFRGLPVPAVVEVVLGSGTGPMLSASSPNSFHSSTSSRSCV